MKNLIREWGFVAGLTAAFITAAAYTLALTSQSALFATPR